MASLFCLCCCRYTTSNTSYSFCQVLLGPIRDGTQDAAWARVEMTFLGVFLYLLIDNFILPNRSDAAIRSLAIESLEQVRGLVSIVAESMDLLLGVGENRKEEEEQEEEQKEELSKELQKMQEMQEQKENESVPTIGDITNSKVYQLMPIDDNIQESITAYRDCLSTTEGTLTALRQNIGKTNMLFSLASNEPQLWFR